MNRKTLMKYISSHKQIINIAVFAIFLLAGSFLNLFTKDRLVSERENRALAQLPEFRKEKLFSGEFFTEYENYFADQFFSRDFFAGVSTDVKALMGFPGAQEVQIVTSEGFNAFEEHVAVTPEDMDQAEVTLEGSTAATTPKDDKSNPQGNEGGEGTAGVEGAAGQAGSTDSGNATGESSGSAGNSEITGTPGSTTPNTSSEAGSNSALPTSVPETSESQTASVPEQPAPSPTSKPARDDDGKTIGKVLIYKDSAYALFPFSEDSGNYYANTLKRFRKEAGEDVTLYSMLVPTSMEFLKEERFQKLTDSQKTAIDYVNARLHGIVPVDAYTPLMEHSDEYVYFRTDHHWTALGAWYAYTGFARAAGFEPVSLDQYKTSTIEDYVGSMYETTGSSNLKRNPDTITVYHPFTQNEYHVYYGSGIKMKVIDMSHADKKIKYRVFLSGDRPLGIIKTDVGNGKKILVIKDSYGNAMVPFLLPHYEEIYVVDPRQYEKNIYNLIRNNGIQEVLFLNYVPILSYNGFVDLIVKVMEAEG